MKMESGYCLKLRDTYTNESLEEFVTNKNETIKTLDYKGEIIQKLNQFLWIQSSHFVKAHFYSPTKQVFGI